MQKILKTKFFPILIFLFIALILTLSWFREGFIYGGGDVGLQTYNPQRIFEISKYIWWEATAPGTTVPQALIALPFNFVFSILQIIGFSSLLLQATLFFLTLSSMGIGMYFLLKFIFKDLPAKHALFGALFYLFNPYMMISVWHRFVHSTFFLVAALPFLVISWLKWIKEGKLYWLFLFLVTNLLALYAFGTIAYVFTIWLLLTLISLPEIIFPLKNIQITKKIIFRFFLGFLFWVITNIWWLVPLFNISPGLLSQQHTNEETITSLINISRQAILPYSLQMINPFYLFYQQDFGISYLTIIVRLIPWLFVLIIFIGFIRAIKLKDLSRWPFVYLIIVLLSKGVSSPFGFGYILGMEHFFSLGVFRNPFEKIGVLIPLVSVILFVSGLIFLDDFFAKRWNKKVSLFLVLIIVLVIISFCWPMFVGKIFGKIEKPEYVKVPNSYVEADAWIKSDLGLEKGMGKILHLPLTRNEAISYKWENGYSGLESSALFFTSLPSISHGFNIKRIDDTLTAFYLSFNKLDQDKILRFLQDFNVSYIVLHKDVIWQNSDIFDPSQTEDVLNKLKFLNLSFKIGDLLIYKVAADYQRPRIYLADDIKLVYPPTSASLWPWKLSEKEIFLTPQDEISKQIVTKEILVFPKSQFVYNESSQSALLNVAYNLVQNPQMIDVWLKPLIETNNVLRQNGEIEAENLNNEIISITKNLLKITQFIVSSRQINKDEFKSYKRGIEEIFSSNLSESRLLLYIGRDSVSTIFQLHLSLLNALSQTFTSENYLKEVVLFLNQKLIEGNFISKNWKFQDQSTKNNEIKVFNFEIVEEGDYEIFLTLPDDKNVDQINLKEIKIKVDAIKVDGEENQSDILRDNQLVKLGNHYFLKGDHQIIFNIDYKDLTQEDIFLRKNNPNNLFTETDNKIVEMKRISPVLYTGKLQIRKPTFLIFSEAYNKGWQLNILNKDKNLTAEQLLANLYANAYFINQTGDFDFKLEFKPQRLVNYGLWIGLISYLSLVLYIIGKRIKND